MSILWIDHTLYPSVCFVFVQPFPTNEDRRHSVGCVCNLDPAQKPSRTESGVIMFHVHAEQIAQVQQFQNKPVRVAALKQVLELLGKLPLAGVAIGAEDGNKDVGVGACALLVACDNDELVFYRYEALGLAGEALDELAALESLELIPFRGKKDGGDTTEDIPE